MTKFLPFIIVLLAATMQLNAQSVGLVLSGGGAKGMAHIGVIRVLEENNIPIDYIAGTSIGAIIGGLYAAGYTPDEMEEMFKSDNFYFWSTGKIQREYRYYFKRPEPTPSWIDLKVAKRKEKVKLLPPAHIIPAEQMDFAFMELTAATNAACNYDFNNLMVPYFCVAADVNKSQPVLLRNGDLGSAMRASMTVPLYFKPIKIDGNLLFDGGILNNFPTREMMEIFKPDIIIGHKVANNMRDAEADDLLLQVANMVMRPTDFEIDAKDGILLETKFDDVSLLDFNKIDAVLESGLETAQSSIDSIKNLIQRRVSQSEVDKRRSQFNSKKPQLFFQNVQVEGVNDPMQRQFIIQSMKHDYDVVSLSTLKTEYFKLVADEHLKSIRPLTQYNEETGYFDLHLKVEPEKRVDVSIGGNLSTKPINQGFASFNFRTYNRRAYTLNSNLYFGRFYSSFKFGGRIDYPTRLPFYLATYFTLNRWDYFSSSSELFFEDVKTPYIIQDENNLRAEAGFPLGLHSKFYTGVAYSNASDEYYPSEDYEDEDEPDKTNFNSFVVQAGIENNSLNYKQYATEGTHQSINGKFVTGQENYYPGSTTQNYTKQETNHNYFQLNASTLRYYTLGKKVTLGTHFEGAMSNKNLFNTYQATMLSAPAFTPTPHSKSLFIPNFHANIYMAGGVKAIYNFSQAMHLRVEGYAFVPIKEVSKSSNNLATKSDKFINNYYLQGMTSLVYQTGIGPISLSLNYYEKDGTNLYMTLNFGYILFNKRGL